MTSKSSTPHETLGNYLGGLFVAFLLTILCVVGIAPNQANGALRAVAGGSGGGGTVPTATCSSPGGVIYASAGAFTCNPSLTTDGNGAVSASASVTSPIVQSASNLSIRSNGASTDAATVANNLVTFNGGITVPASGGAGNGLNFGSAAGAGFYSTSATQFYAMFSGSAGWNNVAAGPILNTTGVYGWGSIGGAADTSFSRCSAATICAGNGSQGDSSASIKGVTTNSSAPAGSIGEFINASVASTGAVVTISSNTPVTVVSTGATVTAGDYDVQGLTCYISATTTSFTVYKQGINTTTNAFGTLGTYTSSQFAAMVPLATTASENCQQTPLTRISLSGTSNVFMVAAPIFSVSGTITAYGFLRLRRVR